MSTAILLQLLLAHILTDFVFQPDSWVEKKNSLGLRSSYYWYHVVIAGLTTYVLLHQWQNLLPPAMIMVSHAFIDQWKIIQVRKRGKEQLRSLFFWDQLLHLTVIVFIWLYLTGEFEMVLPFLSEVLGNSTVMAVITASVFITQPAGVIIGKITEPLRNELSADDSLKRAGQYIGITERILVFIFVLLGQYAVIGFLIAGKSILRITKEGEQNARKKTEYVLIGTLISFIVAVSAGLLIKVFFNI